MRNWMKRPATVWVAWHVAQGRGGICFPSCSASLEVFERRGWEHRRSAKENDESCKPRRFVALDDLRAMTRAEREAWVRRGR